MMIKLTNVNYNFRWLILGLFLTTFLFNDTIAQSKTKTKVSDEVVNAFFLLDNGIKNTNKIVAASTTGVITSMDKTAATKMQYLPLVDKAQTVRQVTVEFNDYINELRARMVEESGGAYSESEAEASGFPALAGQPKGKRDKATPLRIFISGNYGNQDARDPEGPILDKKIQALRAAYLTLLASLWENGGIPGTIFADPSQKEEVLKRLEQEMTLVSSDAYDPAAHEGKGWSEFTFGNMPVAAVYPVLRKFQNDARTTEAVLVNFLANQIGRLELNYDKFEIFAQSPKPYILLGETYEAEIALGAYSSQAQFAVSVNGSHLKIIDGKAKYVTKGTSIGEKKYTAKVSVKNPMTGEIETMTKDFYYEVGQRAISVSADKMNVFYVGVENPITIAAAGIKTSSLKVSITGGTLLKHSPSSYTVTATEPGLATITVADAQTGKRFLFQFRVKRIPDPVVRLSRKVDGSMSAEQFKAQPGLLAWLDNFDFDAKCQVESYNLYYIRKGEAPVELKGSGARFSGEILAAIQKAKPGDQYIFTEVKAKCPGDKSSRRVNGLAFKIK